MEKTSPLNQFDFAKNKNRNESGIEPGKPE
jgi:hypothetical protein